MHTYKFLFILVIAGLAIAHPQGEAFTLNQHGLAAADRRDYIEAEKDYRQAVILYRAQGADYDTHLGIELFNLAEALCGQGRWRESKDIFAESLTLTSRTMGPKHLRTLTVMNALGNVHALVGDPEGAERILNQALALARENYPNDIQFAHALAGISSIRLRAEKPDEALPYAEEALSVTLKAEPQEGGEAAMMYQNVAQVHRAAHRLERAMPLYHKSRAILERLGRTEEPRYASLLSQEGLAFMDEGKVGLAERDLKAAVDLLTRISGSGFELATAQNNLGLLRIRQKKYEEANELLTKALTAEEKLNPEDAVQIGKTRDALLKVRSTLR